MGIWSPLPNAPSSLLPSTYTSQTGWGMHLHDLTSKDMVLSVEGIPYQHSGGKGS